MISIGKYDLHELLGRGGFGEVYLAEDKDLSRIVALKVLHPSLAPDPEFIRRFNREARVLAGLEHENIVAVYEMGVASGRFFIAMRNLSGGSLAKKIKSGPLPVKQAIEILQDVCAGLQEAHNQKIVHCDLKPSNILFDGRGRAYVTDFGLSRVFQAEGDTSYQTSAGMELAGTLSYLPPECWNNQPVSPASDVYALGCILYEMLTGKVLFAGSNLAEVGLKHVTGQAVISPNLFINEASGIEEVIRRAISLEPNARQADAAAFIASFEAIQRIRMEAVENARRLADEESRLRREEQIRREAVEGAQRASDQITTETKDKKKARDGFADFAWRVFGVAALFFIGAWWLFAVLLFPPEPVLTPGELRNDLKQIWVRLVVDSYTKNRDVSLAASRIGMPFSEFQTTAAAIKSKVNPADVDGLLSALVTIALPENPPYSYAYAWYIYLFAPLVLLGCGLILYGRGRHSRILILAGAAFAAAGSGLFIGYFLFPVKWVNCTPAQLAEKFQIQYARMAVDSYVKTADQTFAKERYYDLGKQAPALFEKIKVSVNPQEVDRFVFAATGTIPFPVSTSEPARTLTMTPSRPVITNTTGPFFTSIPKTTLIYSTPVRPDTYTIQSGETHYCIARRFNVSVLELMEINGLSVNSMMSVGQTLKIPQGGAGWTGSPRMLHAHPDTYTVGGGDTLNKIACYYGDVYPEVILQVNSLKSAGDLRVGMTLDIP